MLIIRLRGIFLFLVATISLVGCKSYNSSFSCGDAKGLSCERLSIVDQRIDSGEIEEIELIPCRGRACKRNKQANQPSLRIGEIYEASTVVEEKQLTTRIEEALNAGSQ